jgi:hypothetical protein
MTVADRWASTKPTSSMATRFMLRPQTATVLRDSPSSRPGGWASTYITIGTTPCRLTANPSATPTEVEAAGEMASITHWMLNVPPGTDIQPRDRIVVGAVTYEVIGSYPGFWKVLDSHILAEVQR